MFFFSPLPVSHWLQVILDKNHYVQKPWFMIRNPVHTMQQWFQPWFQSVEIKDVQMGRFWKEKRHFPMLPYAAHGSKRLKMPLYSAAHPFGDGASPQVNNVSSLRVIEAFACVLGHTSKGSPLDGERRANGGVRKVLWKTRFLRFHSRKGPWLWLVCFAFLS